MLPPRGGWITVADGSCKTSIKIIAFAQICFPFPRLQSPATEDPCRKRPSPRAGWPGRWHLDSRVRRTSRTSMRTSQTEVRRV